MFDSSKVTVSGDLREKDVPVGVPLSFAIDLQESGYGDVNVKIEVCSFHANCRLHA